MALEFERRCTHGEVSMCSYDLHDGVHDRATRRRKSAAARTLPGAWEKEIEAARTLRLRPLNQTGRQPLYLAGVVTCQ